MKFDFLDSYNTTVGFLIAAMTMIFGEHWYLFALFILLNAIDWLTGWMKSRLLKKENSVKGWMGVLKKLGYWLMILFAFTISTGLIEIGYVLGIDLTITKMLGWFVLASLIVNEARSIIENFVECGYNVPKVLIDGLEVANKLINKEKGEEDYE